jgi:hypothetical protein
MILRSEKTRLKVTGDSGVFTLLSHLATGAAGRKQGEKETARMA